MELVKSKTATEKNVFLRPSMHSYIQWIKHIQNKMSADPNFTKVMQFTTGDAELVVASLTEERSGGSLIDKEFNREIARKFIQFENNKVAFIAKCLETIDDSIVEMLKASETWDEITLKGDTRAFWTLLRNIMQANYGSKAFLQQSRAYFNKINQGDTESLTHLSQRIREAAQELEVLGDPKSEQDMIFVFNQAMHPRRFGELKRQVAIKAQEDNLTLAQILTYAINVGQAQKGLDVDNRFRGRNEDSLLEKKIVAAMRKFNEKDRKRPVDDRSSNKPRFVQQRRRLSPKPRSSNVSGHLGHLET